MFIYILDIYIFRNVEGKYCVYIYDMKIRKYDRMYINN